MIHWAWLIPACMISGGVTLLVFAMFSINKCEDCECCTKCKEDTDAN